MKPKKLPIGQSSFENLISNNFIYVDKTRKLYKLITEGEFYFLSRPRRFGKSLLVSALKNIFLGHKELFKDLWIYTSDYEWKKHPVIVIDFNEVLVDTPENLKSGLWRVFDKIAKEHDICLESKEEKFKRLANARVNNAIKQLDLIVTYLTHHHIIILMMKLEEL